MISSKNIRFHSPSNTYIIPKNSILDQNVAVKGNVIVGPGTRFWKNIKVDGNIQLGKGCIVEGNLKANQVIAGSRSKIKGNITADSDVSLFQNVSVRSVESGGNITIMPECIVGYANGSTLLVIGKAEIKKIGVITKVTVRANTVAGLEDESEESDSEFIGPESSEFTGDKIDFDDSNTLQDISEELIFEDNIIDEIEIESVTTYKNENENRNSANLDSLSTPAFPMEQKNETVQPNAETNINSEKFDAEIIDETDENSPKSFTVSGFAGSPADHPVSVPADESSEVEIIGGFDDSDSNSGTETVFQTVETPFGTIVVGEQPAKNSGMKAAPSDPADNQFASVMESTRDEQQAAFEAEMKIRPTSVDRKSEFKWPAFEPRKMPKTEKEISKTKPASSDNNLFSRKVSSQIEYEEIKIQTPSKQKESFSNPGQANLSEKANRKIVFEEIGGSKSAKTQAQRSKADILMEKMNFDTVSEKPAEAKLSAEKKVKSREEAEKSKVWYEERYPRSESKKKEYPPYV